jgi:hypothetical protein
LFRASNHLCNSEVAVTEDATWQVIGGVVSSVGVVVFDRTKAKGRLVCGVKTSGTQVEMRITEDKNGSVVVLNTSVYQVADTSDAWVNIGFNTDVVPRAGRNTYRLEARLNGATSATIRYAALTLLEVEIFAV